MKPNLRILENGNELINSIACGSKPTARCNRQVDTGLTRTQSLLLRSNYNVR
ncbi:MAG: hypothetical protein IPL26_15855 [Leptospiraceae bacterium]|nr:hypothetical protein [Leptospiraceae bacterium]